MDPHYLSWLAREYDFETSFITLSARINEEMPHYVTNAVVQAVADQPRTLSDTEVLLLGVAFKPNVEDTRHTPAHSVVRLLRERGLETLRYADPHVEEYTVPGDKESLPRVEVTPDTLASHDVVVILTDHDAFDYERIARHASCVVDTRNAIGDQEQEKKSNVRTLGNGSFQTGRPAPSGINAPLS